MTDVSVLREIDPSAHIAPDAVVGPYCVVGPHVTIGPGTVLERRVTVLGHTSLGSDNLLAEGCVLGAIPQDLKYAGGQTLLLIGHRNRFGREVTAHIGTEPGGFVTRIGDDNLLMDGCHVAHDCYLDDRIRLGRRVLLAGHIRIHTGAVIEDLSGLHHFVTIGRFACVGPHTPVRRDVPPFTDFRSLDHDWISPPAVRGPHEAGIRAAGLGSDEEKELRFALRELFDDEAALQNKIEQLVNMGVEGEAAALCEFCNRSLQGVYGRYRERFRGTVPPEAEPYLPRARGIDTRRTMP
ncbi:MAG TPA: acyl-[acyl-carrier-protein]--UDP-N-acetylglucosamine O-acyltransferase [Phycisphaerae bacterium]|nr:acyl-[acyl-carrier-protein]--UDP-N-acetylglucosamine O-acyltransferase [Phycisphaerae bacterium]